MSAVSPNRTDQWPQSLLDLLEAQQAMVDRLAQLTHEQTTMIADGRTDRLLELLGQRQLIIDEFTASQQRLGELTQSLDRSLDSVTDAQREQIKSLINSIGEQLTRVMQRDEQDQASLRNDRDRVKGEISSLGAAKQARNAYRTNTPPNTRFADERG